MIFDGAENVAMSEPEGKAAQQNARMRLRVRRRSALYSTGAFLLNCASIYPFLDGHSLHPYWESFGKYLILLSLALMLASLYSVLLLWGAWRLLRDLESGHI
jgi:hypothetical protein